jgi:hypothetical protein
MTTREKVDIRTTREIARDYVRSQFVIMEGSAEAGIRRIGIERYERIITEVQKILEKTKQITNDRFREIIST